MGRAHGFPYGVQADGTVVITHRGRTVGTLRGGRAEKFPAEAESGDAQPVTARWNGSYRFGNEHTARDHPATGAEIPPG
ncbi:hypothetical protein [Streptomyces sp. NPDC001389]|uniref:hypothetical protein n=1 Tax=unclassified Streptomyces TaxID=2593676 RepID=UPI0036CEEC6C